MSLPRKIMEQCRLCPTKLWSNADFAPRDHRAFVLTLPRKIMETSFFAPQNYGPMQTLLRKIMDTEFQGPKNIIKFNFCLFFSNYFCKSLSFLGSLQPFGPLFKEKIFFVPVPLKHERGRWEIQTYLETVTPLDIQECTTHFQLKYTFQSHALRKFIQNWLANKTISKSVL